jgi:PKD repeat protein
MFCATRAGAAFVFAGLTMLLASCTRDLAVEPPRISLTPQLLAPSNDSFGNATVIAALPFSDSVDITDATMEADERTPSCASDSSTQRTVWYAFTPTVTGMVTASIHAGFSTVVAVDTGSVFEPIEVTCHTSSFGGSPTFQAEAGTTYYFQVDGMFGHSGLLEFRLDAIVPPPNDNFVDAASIPAPPFSSTVDITNATTEPDEPTPSCSFGSASRRTVWYAFTPTATKVVLLNANAGFSTAVAAYTGGSPAALTEVACRSPFGGTPSFRAEAGTTYFFQVDGMFGQAGVLEFRLDVAPPPVASFGFFPFDPSVFDVVQFFDQSFDPAGVGFAPQAWTFGDGTTGIGGNPTHRYAADGEYTVRLTLTTLDGRTATTSRPAHVRTHDVAVTRLSVPQTGRSGQTRQLTVSVNSKRYAETVEVQLFRSVPSGFQQFGSLTQSVPMNPKNGTTDFAFSYTFTAGDAQIGKVTFKAFAAMSGARDALPADNDAIGPPTRVSR